MNNEKIKSILLDKLQLHKLYVTGNTYHIKIVAIGDVFIGLNSLEKQQIIYKPLKNYIINNIIHSISIKSYTLKEWFLRTT